MRMCYTTLAPDFKIALQADVLWASSRVSSPRTSFVGEDWVTSQIKCLRRTLVFPDSREKLVLKRIMNQSLATGNIADDL